MKMSPQGRKVLAKREGRRLRAYKDSAGIWTIGIGHTSAAGLPKVTPGLTITEAECDAIFARDLEKYESAVDKVVRAPLEQHEFDALVSLCYNIGQAGLARSTVVRRLNAGDRLGAAEAFLMWNRPAEILSRRRAELVQFRGQGYVARLGAGEKPTLQPTPARASLRPKSLPLLTALSTGWRWLSAKINLTNPSEDIPMINPNLPLVVVDLIRRAVESAVERPDAGIPAEHKTKIVDGVVREAKTLPELRTIEQAVVPKSKWQSKGMIGALVSGLAGIAGAFGFVLAPEEVDAVVGIVSNTVVVVGAVMAWIGRKNATQPVA
jgi:lysozyme